MRATMSTDAVAAAVDQLHDTIIAVRGALARRGAAAWLPERDPAEVAAELVAHLGQGGDVAEAAVGDVAALVWPTGLPAGADPWWRTPLGALAFRALVRSDAAMSGGEAAGLLGVSRARVWQLVAAGKLERHPSGGVTRASVAARYAERGRAGEA